MLPGHYFFPGLEVNGATATECIRMSYAEPDAKVEAGVAIIAEVLRAYGT
ncbi:MAG: hypothetical protein R2851_28385 [Caldilineaceae bacterium]